MPVMQVVVVFYNISNIGLILLLLHASWTDEAGGNR
jgi:hypothetical protein